MKSLLRPLFDKTPIKFTPGTRSDIFHGTPQTSEAQLRSYASISTLFAIVHRLSNATSQVRWHLYRKPERASRSRSRDDRIEVTSHAALDIWNQPNPFMTQQEFVEVFQQHVDLVGEAYWLVGTNDTFRLPLELWPVRPDRMEPVPHPTEYLSGYLYHGPDGVTVPLGTDEIIQLRMPNPLDPYRGLGPVQSLLVDMDSERYTAEWNRNFFINSAEPGGIIQVSKRLNDDEFKEAQQRWAEGHRGVANAHRLAIVEQGEYKPNAFSMKDMQFVELRGFSQETIRGAFGFPKPMLGAVDDVNRANAEAGEVVFARYLMIPRLERIKQALNNDFLPKFGDTARNLEFDYENPIPEDRAADDAERGSKTSSFKTLIDAGVDPDDAADAVGLPRMNMRQPMAAGEQDAMS